MILILSTNTDQQGVDYQQLIAHLTAMPGIQARVHVENGVEQVLTEIYLIGHTKALDIGEMQSCHRSRNSGQCLAAAKDAKCLCQRI